MSQEELGQNHKKQTCKTVLQRLIQDSNQYKFGRTKIFFRAGQVAYLEKLRLDLLRRACVTIQKHVRGKNGDSCSFEAGPGHCGHSEMVEVQKALVLQKYARAWLARRRFQTLYARAWLARRRFQTLYARAWLARRRFQTLYARAWLARRCFQTLRYLVHNIQLSYRCQRLRKKLEDQGKENRRLSERLTGLAGSHAQGLDKLHCLEAQLGKSAAEKASLEDREKKSKEDATKMIAQFQEEKYK
ncbi:unnamed protein product [Coregonus sp. 'balchen']|nr:unnamed protein product [Coregonus sp. 'balchen']